MTDILTSLSWDDAPETPEIQERIKYLADWQKLPPSHFMAQVEKGRAGTSVGHSNGLVTPNRYLYGTHRGRYYLVGADSGVGKTTLTDFMYVLKLYESCKLRNIPLFVYYYSFEISKEEKIARWVSYYLHLMYNISLPSDYIMGRIEGLMVSDEHLEKVRLAYVYIERMMKDWIIIEDPVHPTKIFHDLVDEHYDKKVGKVKREMHSDPKKKGRIVGFTPAEGMEQAVTLVVVDHVGLTMPEQGFDLKATIDLLSRYFVTLRNIFGLTSVVVQQFNTDITSTYRMNKFNDGIVKPQRVDFGDSRYTYRDANVVFGMIKPSMYDIPKYMEYDVKQLREYLVMLFLMKNRHGASGKVFPLFIDPLSGTFEDLPLKPTVELEMRDYYERANKLDTLCQLFSPKNP